MRYALVVLLAFSLAWANPAEAKNNRCRAAWAAVLGLTVGIAATAGIRFWVRESPPSVGHETEFGEEDGLCCLCRYQPVDECATLSEQKCAETKIPPRHKQDCRWHLGNCQSRFATYCEKWRDAPEQKGCLVKITQVEGSAYELKQAFTGKGCRKVRYRYTGHGRTGLTLRNTVSQVVGETPPEITSFQFDDDGCSTFSNLEKSTTRMREFIDEEHALFKGKSVLISANQCNANIEAETQARYLFEIDGTRAPAAMDGRASPCGTSCRKFQSGQSVSCLHKGALVRRTCRCSTGATGESCRWE